VAITECFVLQSTEVAVAIICLDDSCPTWTRSAALNLRQYTSRCDQSSKAILAGGGVEALVRLLTPEPLPEAVLWLLTPQQRSKSDSKNLRVYYVQQEAALALTAIMAASDAARAALVAAGGVGALVRQLDSTYPGAQCAAAGALRMLSEGSDSYKNKILTAGGVPQLVQLLSSRDLDVHEYAVQALASLTAASGAAYGTAVASAGGITPLVKHLYSTGAVVQQCAAQVLMQLRSAGVVLSVYTLSSEETEAAQAAADVFGDRVQHLHTHAMCQVYVAVAQVCGFWQQLAATGGLVPPQVCVGQIELY